MDNNRRPALLIDVTSIPGGLRYTVTERNLHSLGTLASVAEQDVDPARLLGLHGELTQALHRASREPTEASAAFERLRQCGQMLFAELFPPQLKHRLRSTAVRDLIFTLDESLVYLPWELLHTGRGFLALLYNVGRLVRTSREPNGQPRQLAALGARSALLLCDPRSDLLAAYDEGITLRDNLEQQAPFFRVDLRASRVSLSDVQACIHECDILHYAGHAESALSSSRAGGWKLSDGLLGPEQIARLAGGAPLPALVFANACASAQTAGGADDQVEARVFDMARAFLLGGVQCFVGTLWEVPDDSARLFALAFYRALVRGESVGRSLMAARGELLSHHGVRNVLWASWVLYGDPTAVVVAPGQLDSTDSGHVVHLPPPPPTGRMKRLSSSPQSHGSVQQVAGIRSAAAVAQLQTPLAPWAALIQRIVPWTWGLALTLGVLLTGHVWTLLHHPETTLRVDAARPSPQPAIPWSSAASLSSVHASLPHVELDIITQGLDARGQAVRRPLDDGGELPVGASFQVALRLAQPAYVALYHLSEQGELDILLQMSPEEWKRHRRGGELILPGPDASFFLEGPPGVHSLIAMASHEAPGDSSELHSDMRHILRQVLTESPAYRVQSSPRVSLKDGRRDEQIEVTYMPVDHFRLSQALSTRVRKSLDTAAVRSFSAR